MRVQECLSSLNALLHTPNDMCLFYTLVTHSIMSSNVVYIVTNQILKEFLKQDIILKTDR